MVAKNREQPPSDGEQRRPHAFLSYASEDKEFAEQVAKALQEKGIETWWDKWEIRHGDSIRQKVDEGIAACTHFLVLLTHQSICKPWVSTEMDAAFVRKLEGKCRFIPVRYKLHVSDLPPTLRGVLSLKIESGTDIDGLISDIYEISKKPALGVPPAAVQQAQKIKTGYSPAVQAVAKLLVEESKYGMRFEPKLRVEELVKKTKLTLDDVLEAINELEEGGFVTLHRKVSLASEDPRQLVIVENLLFVEFDRFWMEWDTEEDARRIATDMVNDEDFPSGLSNALKIKSQGDMLKQMKQIASRYNWKPRRLNPALCWLRKRKLATLHQALGTRGYVCFAIDGNFPALRRFIKRHRDEQTTND